MRIIYYYSALAVKNIQVNLIFDFIQVSLRSLRKNKFFHSLVFTFSLVCAHISLSADILLHSLRKIFK